MSDIAVNEQSFASGRYSKRKRTQVTYYMDELDVSDSESDFESAPAKKRKVPAPKPLPKSKIFPFMQLPAEIRNIIYNYTLADASGINLVGAFKQRRRTVQRISADTQSHIRNRSRSRVNRILGGAGTTEEEPVELVPSLLAVSKQIYQEACDILYGNDFIFTDTFALYNFLLNLGPSGAKHLKHVQLLGWGYGRGMKGYNHACFAVLVWATNLSTFHLSDLAGYSSAPKGDAMQLYRDAFPWLEAVGAAKGKVDAAVDVLRLSSELFQPTVYYGQNRPSVTSEEKEKEFLGELSKLLCAQQQRVMAPPKKKKVA